MCLPRKSWYTLVAIVVAAIAYVVTADIPFVGEFPRFLLVDEFEISIHEHTHTHTQSHSHTCMCVDNT